MSSGALDLTVLGDRWRLRAEHFAWIPSGMVHEMAFDGPGALISLYLDPALRPGGESWNRPRVVRADGLACSLLLHLADSEPGGVRRLRCRELLTDLLASAPVDRGALELPRDPRAHEVAAAIVADPADPRELRDWAESLGVNAKTIARAFTTDTGVGFRLWRTRARLHAAAGMLASGHSVSQVATDVGFISASSFIVAFKSRFGVTPARYAKSGTRTAAHEEREAMLQRVAGAQGLRRS